MVDFSGVMCFKKFVDSRCSNYLLLMSFLFWCQRHGRRPCCCLCCLLWIMRVYWPGVVASQLPLSDKRGVRTDGWELSRQKSQQKFQAGQSCSVIRNHRNPAWSVTTQHKIVNWKKWPLHSSKQTRPRISLSNSSLENLQKTSVQRQWSAPNQIVTNKSLLGLLKLRSMIFTS